VRVEAIEGGMAGIHGQVGGQLAALGGNCYLPHRTAAGVLAEQCAPVLWAFHSDIWGLHCAHRGCPAAIAV
jgi:hypothetical protein